MESKKEKTYISIIVCLIILCVWFWNLTMSTNGNQPLDIRDNLLKAGAVVAFGQNITNLNNSTGIDIIRNKRVKPCVQIQVENLKKQVKNECRVRIVKENGNVVLVTKDGQQIVPKDVTNRTIVLYSLIDSQKTVSNNLFNLIQPISTAEAADHEVCLSDLNGSQHDFCWPKTVIREWCRTNSHPICTLV